MARSRHDRVKQRSLASRRGTANASSRLSALRLCLHAVRMLFLLVVALIAASVWSTVRTGGVVGPDKVATKKAVDAATPHDRFAESLTIDLVAGQASRAADEATSTDDRVDGVDDDDDDDRFDDDDDDDRFDENGLLRGLAHEDVEVVVRRLLQAESAAALEAQGTASPLVVIEAGANTPDECTFAATLGYTTHCFEPSPKSYQLLEKSKKEAGAEVGARLVPHPEAASGIGGLTLSFRSTGGPGDHLGEYDMWRMERKMSKTESANPKSGEIIQVKTAKLDNLVMAQNAGQRQWRVHLLKVETMGHEVNVFHGLKLSLKAGAVKYIIFQFWPRALDLMKKAKGCEAGTGALKDLIAAGYRLHPLRVMSHEKAPFSGRKGLREEEEKRPAGPLTVDTSQAYCQWFLDVEGRHPSKPKEEEYKFGYWSHFVAVAPGAELPEEFSGAYNDVK